MQLDVRPLLAGDRLLRFAYELPIETDPEDASSVLFGVRFPSPMKVEGDITNTAGYMRMRLSLSVDYETDCARCLAPVSGAFTFDLEKTVAPKDVLEGIDEDKADDYVIVEDGFLDPDVAVLEELGMEFPSRFLCSPDCKGLCPVCGGNLNEKVCDCATREVDPRLAPLQKILDKMKQEEK